MRDIVTSNGFGAGNVQTKSKIVKMQSTTGTLTKHDYRSYRDFLESYNDNKNSKDDQESVSSNDSGISSYKLSESKSSNTSTSSLNSEINGCNSKSSCKPEQTGLNNRTGSFRNYLDTYNNKKFSSVKPQLPPKKNLVKSEIIIQVNDPAREKMEPDSCCVTTINGDQVENNFDFIAPAVNVEAPNFPPPPPPLQMSENHIENIASPPLPPPPPPQFPAFNAANTQNGTVKKWATVKTEGERPKPNSPEKLPTNNAAAANLAKILTQHLLPRRQALEAEMAAEKATEKKPDVQCSKPSGSVQVSKINGDANLVIPPAPKLPNNPSSNKVAEVRVVPKFPQPSALNGVNGVPKNDSKVFKSEMVQKTVVPKLPKTAPPFKPNGRSSPNGNGMVDYSTKTVVPVNDTTGKVSKTDPNVRKLVYNTYRGLLGAYNNKANDMISTLPRNMVREDQGITKQLESMALQGGLEKLNGRTNPNVEQE